MRKFEISLIAALALAISGCAAVKSDLRDSGGFTGSQLDKRMIKASHSKRIQVLRGALIVAMLARAGTVYARQGRENLAYVDSINDSVDEINVMAGYVFPNSYACDMAGLNVSFEDIARHSPDSCSSYSANFESDVPRLERRIFQLLVVALPQDAAKKFLSSVKGGNMLDAAWSAAKLVFAATDGLHNAAAVSRTSLKIQAAAKCDDEVKQKGADYSVVDAVRCLGLDKQHIFVSPNGEIALNESNTHILLTAVMQNIRDSCLSVPDALDLGDAAGNSTISQMRDSCASISFEPHPRFGPDGKRWLIPPISAQAALLAAPVSAGP